MSTPTSAPSIPTTTATTAASDDHHLPDSTSAMLPAAAASRKLAGWDLYKTVFRSAKHIVAPMVDQSEHAWRLLSLRYGAHLCYTPMFHARLFAENESYRREQFTSSPQDRPLVVQFCANDPDTLLRAAKLVEDKCDAVDLNLGCPQGIAKRGKYGSFLMEDWDLIERMVRKLHAELAIPVTCKIRVYPDIEKTVAYAQMLERAGCQILTVHGRLREQKGQMTGLADWAKIKAVKQAVSIPVFANGNILYFEDVERCLAATGCEGVMSAEGNLFNPALFADVHPPVWQLANEYLQICREHHTETHMIRAHLFRVFRTVLTDYTKARDALAKANTMEGYQAVTDMIEAKYAHEAKESGWDVAIKSSDIPNNASGYKELPVWVCQPYMREQYPADVSGRPAGTQATAGSLSPASAAPAVAAADEPTPEELAQRKLELARARAERKLLKRKRKEEHNQQQMADRADASLPAQKRLRGKPRCPTCLNVISAKCPSGMCKPCCQARNAANVAELIREGKVKGVDELGEKLGREDTEVEGKVVACPAHGKGWGKVDELLARPSATQPTASMDATAPTPTYAAEWADIAKKMCVIS
ncbi:dihydrouridine synthase-domain-containing protein [Catenaria anguillulae PL171]|uniref:tRNA-dihydrouridine(16/17) synthase [NAD(P)(+)] n=1 Tax=Catenaria anguillulae PL171 TaxID=765915 RepID=A0A1Y2HSA0_9FUNG|nr:dihydrouridine synthase-domain-containing protein [Catenaria anguillulae PL171]